jgi:hypothetical protein
MQIFMVVVSGGHHETFRVPGQGQQVVNVFGVLSG